MKKKRWLRNNILGSVMVGLLLEIISSQSMGSNDDYGACPMYALQRLSVKLSSHISTASTGMSLSQVRRSSTITDSTWRRPGRAQMQ